MATGVDRNLTAYGDEGFSRYLRRAFLASAGWDGEDQGASNRAGHRMALPAYDQCIKASHIFNLLDARGVISVTERQSYILRVRELAKACGKAWLATEGGGNSHE